MAQVGAYTVAVMRGNVQPPAQVLRDITRPGVNGNAYQYMGLRAKPSAVETLVDVSNQGNAASTLAGYRELIGTSVTVVDGHGVTYLNVLVRDVEQVRIGPVTAKSGGVNPSATAVLEARWTLEWQA